MVRQTKTIAETINEAKEYLSRVKKNTNREMRFTVMEGQRYLQATGELDEKRRRIVKQKPPAPLKKTIKKERLVKQEPIQLIRNQSKPKKASKLVAKKQIKGQKKQNIKKEPITPQRPQKHQPQPTKAKPAKAQTVAAVNAKNQPQPKKPQKLQNQNSDVEKGKTNKLSKEKVAPPPQVQKVQPPHPVQDTRKKQEAPAVTGKQTQKVQVQNAVQKQVTKKIQKQKPQKQEPKKKPSLLLDKVIQNEKQHEKQAEKQVEKVNGQPQSPKQKEKKPRKPRQKKNGDKQGAKEPPTTPQEVNHAANHMIIKQELKVEAIETVEPVEQVEEPQQLIQRQVPIFPRRTNTEPGMPTAGIIDVCFVVDTTGSMDAYLEQTKVTVNTLVDKIRETSKEHDISVRFGFVAYRDHPPQELTYITQVKDLCSTTEVLEFIESLNCQGGGDGAEAVFDGLHDAATKISWRASQKVPSLRYIFHIGDQPPHGTQYGGYSESWSDGCPCNITLEKITFEINIREIHYRLIKVSDRNLEKMSEIFKANFTNYEETTLDKGNAENMDVRITDMVIRELHPDYAYE